jgi:hypothetical protein
MILLCRDGVLHPFIALSFGTLFSFVALPRFNTSAFCALGDRISDGSTLGGDQWDPGHVNLVALLHERRLEPPPNGMGSPKEGLNTCLETRCYLKDSKRIQSHHQKSKADRYDKTKMQVASSHLST